MLQVISFQLIAIFYEIFILLMTHNIAKLRYEFSVWCQYLALGTFFTLSINSITVFIYFPLFFFILFIHFCHIGRTNASL